MPHHYKSIEIKMESGMLPLNKPVGGADILKCSGPSAAVVAYTPIFDIEGGDTCGS
jgi:hypothetical protein